MKADIMTSKINEYLAELSEIVTVYSLSECRISDVILSLHDIISYAEIEKYLDDNSLPYHKVDAKIAISWAKTYNRLIKRDIPVKIIIRQSLTRWKEVVRWVTPDNCNEISFMMGDINYRNKIQNKWGNKRRKKK